MPYIFFSNVFLASLCKAITSHNPWPAPSTEGVWVKRGSTVFTFAGNRQHWTASSIKVINIRDNYHQIITDISISPQRHFFLTSTTAISHTSKLRLRLLLARFGRHHMETCHLLFERWHIRMRLLLTLLSSHYLHACVRV